MCTGTFYEEGRPSAGTKCVKPCVIESARWGSSYCYTEGGNWGAECVTCPGKIYHYNETRSKVRTLKLLVMMMNIINENYYQYLNI
jgi:hypothetical protein